MEDNLLNKAKRFFNRELSWLSFNKRVLAEASVKHHPLLERLRFLAISSNNIDEFIMVRMAGLISQHNNNVKQKSIDGLTPLRQIELCKKEIREIFKKQKATFKILQEELKHQDIFIHTDIHKIKNDKKIFNYLEKFFIKSVKPALSCIKIDNENEFPFIPNLSLSILVNNEHDKPLEIITLPSNLSRFVIFEDGAKSHVFMLEDVITLFINKILNLNGKFSCSLFRIIRDSEIEISEEAEDLMSHLELAVKRRRRGKVILLEGKNLTEPVINFLCEKFNIKQKHISHPLDILYLSDINNLLKILEKKFKPLFYKKLSPHYPSKLKTKTSFFDNIKKASILLHHPYDDFKVIVDFLNQAAEDEDVVAIKQTLYRTSEDSAVMKALIKAANNGKSVTVVVELKARFDEESNLKWARNLERAGVQVVFGFVTLKTHAKISLVIRQEKDNLTSYMHLGTGNYHPGTAKSYSDISILTCDNNIATDAAAIFNYLTGSIEPENYKKLIVAPFNLRPNIIELIDLEIDNAKNNKPAFIYAKMNSLIDSKIIDKLYEASNAGVKIKLIVRGLCCLRPNIKGLSENIEILSIIGRFLEHSRIFCFANGNNIYHKKNKLFIASADWMPRNFDRRIELMIPIEDKKIHKEIINNILLKSFNDNKQCWSLKEDGQYERLLTNYGETAFSSHEYFLEN